MPNQFEAATTESEAAPVIERTLNGAISVAQRIKNHALPQIKDILAKSGTPSVTFAVSHGCGAPYISHLGYRDVELKLVANDQTRFNINSMTKGIVAAVTGIEVAKGTLLWTTRIKDAIPEFASSDSVVEEASTVLDMLSHRTGISNFDSPWLQSQNTILLGRDQTIKTFATLKPCLPFRTSFIYNNWGYELVGEILKRRTGRKLSQLLQDSVFTPLGMSRTSTSWDPDDKNQAKSYAVLDDFTSVEITPPQLGQGTLMEAAGGVKSTIADLMVLYKAYLQALKDQFKNEIDETTGSIFKHCRSIITNHARFEGPALREQGYGAGWARSQLPGQMGRISLNTLLGEEPTVGKGGPSHLVIYHHGSMPGSTSCVIMIPETDKIIIVFQNSLAPLDTADFIGQLLVETVLNVQQPNDYGSITHEFVQKSFGHMDKLKAELEARRELGTHPQELKTYVGRYWNLIHNFCIDVTEHSGKLQICFQGSKEETYTLQHYQHDSFTWWMSYNDAARRGRYVTDFDASYYLLKFETPSNSPKRLKWAWDPHMPTTEEVFTETPDQSRSVPPLLGR